MSVSLDWASVWQSIGHEVTRLSSALASDVASDPAGFHRRYEGHVAAFVQLMAKTRASLQRYVGLAMQTQDPVHAERARQAAKAWAQVASAWGDVAIPAPAQQPEATSVEGVVIGAFPVALVVWGVAVTVVGVAFAIAATAGTTALRDWVDLQHADLEARVSASREGRTLQPPTVPPPPGGDLVGVMSKVLFGLGVLGVFAMVVPKGVMQPLAAR